MKNDEEVVIDLTLGHDGTYFVDQSTGVQWLTMDGYECIAKSLAVYPNIGSNLIYPVLGLTEEAGEVAGKIKKFIRAGFDLQNLEDADRRMVAKELGDVLWYVTAMANELGFTLEEVAEMNIEKLLGRKERGTLAGSSGDKLGEGDDR